MINWHLIKCAITYQLEAQTKYYLHSPFVFSFFNEVLEQERNFYAFNKIEDLRHELLKQKRIIEVKDLGAGSKVSKSNTRSISEITKYAAVSPKFGEMLFKLLLFSEAEHILELGTSMGIGTAYLASANTNAKVVTIEGCPNISAKANEHLKSLGIHNTQQLTGDFSDKLPEAIKLLNEKIDFAYLDGNHQYQPSIDYFELLAPYLHENSVVVLDDIHWSEGMEKAWLELKNKSNVSVSIDLFRMGVLFFHQHQKKEDFILRF